MGGEIGDGWVWGIQKWVAREDECMGVGCRGDECGRGHGGEGMG